MKKSYEDAVQALNGALLQKQANSHLLAELLSTPGAVYAAGLQGTGGALRTAALTADDTQKGIKYHGTANTLQAAALAPIAMELAAPIVAALTPTRTKEEQEAHDKGSSIPDWLIPGVASYNKWKRVGYLMSQKKTASAAPDTSTATDNTESTSIFEKIKNLLSPQFVTKRDAALKAAMEPAPKVGAKTPSKTQDKLMPRR